MANQGDFSKGNLPSLLGSLRGTWDDSRAQRAAEYMPKDTALQKIIDEQTATMTEVTGDRAACDTFKIAFMEATATEATIATGASGFQYAPCDVTGEEVSVEDASYKMSKIAKHAVKIVDEDCGNAFDTNSRVAFALLTGMKKIWEKVAQASLGYTLAFAGENKANNATLNMAPGIAPTSPAVDTLLPADSLDAKILVPYLMRVADFNQFQNPFILDGLLLGDQFIVNQAERGTYAGDTGKATLWDALRYETDAYNFIKAGLADNLFMIDRGSLAFVAKGFAPSVSEGAQERTGDKLFYKLPLFGKTLSNGNPVEVDVLYKLSEEQVGSTGRCRLVHEFGLELKFDLFRAPKWTADGVTGVLSFKRQAA